TARRSARSPITSRAANRRMSRCGSMTGCRTISATRFQTAALGISATFCAAASPRAELLRRLLRLSERIKEAGLVVLDVADRGPDRVGAHQFGRIGAAARRRARLGPR